ncbi:MAG: M20/M25/M40 family metallo-hydrolase, partial [Chloroflexota bacterium]
MVSTSQAALRTRLHNTIDRREAASIEAVRDWLRRPSFSDTGEGMAEAAVYTRDLLAQIAPDAQIVPTAGYPMVLGTVKSKQPDAPTLMVYGLYDVTPLVAEEWSIDDPMRAPIVDAADIGITAITGRVLVGRGANNHKGPVLSSILAVKAMLDVEGDVPVNLIYVIEGEEEIGSPSMAGFVAEHYTLLSTADGVWLPCMQQSSIGSMVLRRAYKGALFADLECKGGEWGGTLDAKHIWAGHSAWIASPAMQLIRGLATLFDDEQRATIDGLDEAREIYLAPDDPAIQKIVDQFRDNPHWQDNLLTNLNVRRLLGDKPLAEHLV